jgi:ribosome-binding factor A
MANTRRRSKVAAFIRREVGQMLISEIKDDRVGAGMVSILGVDVSGDLQHAKITVSIYGTDGARAETMEGLKSSSGFVRRELGHRMNLRRVPEITFVEDNSLAVGDEMIQFLNKLPIKSEEET